MKKNPSRLGRKTSKHPKKDPQCLILPEQLNGARDMDNQKVDNNEEPLRNDFQVFEKQTYENEEGVDSNESAQNCSVIKQNFLDGKKSIPKPLSQKNKPDMDKIQAGLNSSEFVEKKSDIAKEDLNGPEENKSLIVIEKGPYEDLSISCSEQKNFMNSHEEEIPTKPVTCTKKLNFEEMLEEPEMIVEEESKYQLEQNAEPKLPPKKLYEVIEIIDDDDEERDSSSIYQQKETGSNKREVIGPSQDDVVEKKLKSELSTIKLILAKYVCDLNEAKDKIKELEDEMSTLKDENSSLKAALRKKKR